MGSAACIPRENKKLLSPSPVLARGRRTIPRARARVQYIGEQYRTRMGRLIGSQLHQASAHNPLLLAGAISVLGVAAFLACLFPARRASLVNPFDAPRVE